MQSCNLAVTKESPLYESEPWGFESNNNFLNQVIEVQTNYSAISLLRHLLDIEEQLGRTRTSNSGFNSRTIDLDILYFNNDIINTEELTVPHYAMHERLFTLYPLVELIPHFEHPILKKNSLELLNTCSDKNTPKKVN